MFSSMLLSIVASSFLPAGGDPLTLRNREADLVLEDGQELCGSIEAHTVLVPKSARVVVRGDLVLAATDWIRIDGELVVADPRGDLPEDAPDVELRSGTYVEILGQVLGARGSDSPAWQQGAAGAGSDIAVRAPVTWVDGLLSAGDGGRGFHAAPGGCGGHVQVYGACLTRTSDPEFELVGGRGGCGGEGTRDHIDAGDGGRGGDAYVHGVDERALCAAVESPRMLPLGMAMPQASCSSGSNGGTGVNHASGAMVQGADGTDNLAVSGIGGQGGRGNPSADAIGGTGGDGSAGAECCSPPGIGGKGGNGGPGGTGHAGRGGRGGTGGRGGPCASHVTITTWGGGGTGGISLPSFCEQCTSPGRGGRGGIGGNSGNGSGGTGGKGGPGGGGQTPGAGGTGGVGGNGGTDGPGGSGWPGMANCLPNAPYWMGCCDSTEHYGASGSMGDFGPFPQGLTGAAGANGVACPSTP